MNEPDKAAPRSAEELRTEIAETRAELGDTVEQLAAKVDVQEQAKQQIQAVGERVHASAEKVVEAAARAKQAAPAPVQHALDEANVRIQPAARKARERATEDPRKTAALAAAVLISWRLVRRLRKRRSQ
jgi:hypothetical protein